MSLQQSATSKSSSRVESLRAKHRILSQKIEAEQARPFCSDAMLKNLKLEKLKLKEEIEDIRHVS